MATFIRQSDSVDRTGFVADLAFGDITKKLLKRGVTPPENWKPNHEGFLVKEDNGETMILQFYNIEDDVVLDETFEIEFDEASYWA